MTNEPLIRFFCAHCDQPIEAPLDRAGKDASCPDPDCQMPLVVPDENWPSADTAMIRFYCNACRQPIEAPITRLGDDGECPSCGVAITVPGAPRSEPEPDEQTKDEASAPTTPLIDVTPPPPPPEDKPTVITSAPATVPTEPDEVEPETTAAEPTPELSSALERPASEKQELTAGLFGLPEPTPKEELPEAPESFTPSTPSKPDTFGLHLDAPEKSAPPKEKPASTPWTSPRLDKSPLNDPPVDPATKRPSFEAKPRAFGEHKLSADPLEVSPTPAPSVPHGLDAVTREPRRTHRWTADETVDDLPGEDYEPQPEEPASRPTSRKPFLAAAASILLLVIIVIIAMQKDPKETGTESPDDPPPTEPATLPDPTPPSDTPSPNDDPSSMTSRHAERAEEALAQGGAAALYGKAITYQFGILGSPQDEAKARELYEKAANKGHADAQAILAMLLWKSGEADEATQWLTKAAWGGSADAAYILGWRFRSGDQVPKDQPNAAIWLALAVLNGAEGASTELDQTLLDLELGDLLRALTEPRIWTTSSQVSCTAQFLSADATHVRLRGMQSARQEGNNATVSHYFFSLTVESLSQEDQMFLKVVTLIGQRLHACGQRYTEAGHPVQALPYYHAAAELGCQESIDMIGYYGQEGPLPRNP